MVRVLNVSVVRSFRAEDCFYLGWMSWGPYRELERGGGRRVEGRGEDEGYEVKGKGEYER